MNNVGQARIELWGSQRHLNTDTLARSTHTDTHEPTYSTQVLKLFCYAPGQSTDVAEFIFLNVIFGQGAFVLGYPFASPT